MLFRAALHTSACNEIGPLAIAAMRLPALGITHGGLSSLITTHNYHQATHLEAVWAIHSTTGHSVTKLSARKRGFGLGIDG
jgi:hypothetical protein